MPGLSLMTIGAATALHPEVDLALMHIFMAIRAVRIFQVEIANRSAIPTFDGQMALIARYREMAAS